MAYFMVQAAYTAQALAALAKKPEDREAGVRTLAERAGGKLHNFFFCVGEYDVVGIMELPDLAAATAIAVAISSAGHVKAYRTTPLLTSAEGMAAFGKAGGLSYRGPSS